MPGIPQLVAERKDGKRPGYRGDAAYRSGSEQSKTSAGGQGNVGSQASFGGGGGGGGPSPSQDNTIVMENIGSPEIPNVKDNFSDFGFGNFAEFGPVKYGAPSIFNPMSGVYAPTNMMFKNMQTLDRFTKARPDAPSIPGISTLLNAVGLDIPNPLQGFSDFTTAKNRDFFQDVIRAGKIPGLNFSTLSDMSDQQLEDAYQDYMSKRLSGEIDAYGNKLISTGDDNPLQNLLLAQQAAQEPQEKLQGGVGALYAQYMRNLGYML